MEVLHTNPDNIIVENRARKEFKNIEELAASIKEHGLIHPIRVTSDLRLVAGERRLRACKLAGVDVDYIVKENCSVIELKELELRENLDRDDMTWVERDRGLAELHALKQAEYGEAKAGRSGSGHSMADTAALVNRDKFTVVEAVQMSNAIKLFPELALMTSHNEAKKKLKKMTETLAIAELASRRKVGGAGHLKMADEGFIVGDAFAGLSKLPAESVDFCNVDTPYGIDLTENKKIQTDIRTDEDYKEWSRDIYLKNAELTLAECFRILKNDRWLVFFYGQEWYFQLRTIIESVGFKVDKIPACWYGGPGAAQTIAVETNLGRAYEQFFICRKGDPILVKRGRPNVFDFPKIAAQKKIHPTEKPVELMKEIYDTFLLPGQIILSPFIGSGNDGRAAYRHGSHWFGFDLNQDVKNRFLLRVEQDVAEGLYGNNNPVK